MHDISAVVSAKSSIHWKFKSACAWNIIALSTGKQSVEYIKVTGPRKLMSHTVMCAD